MREWSGRFAWEPTVEMSEPIEDDEGIASARQDRATTPNVSVQRQPVVGRASRSGESTPMGLEEVGQSDMVEERVKPPRRTDTTVEMWPDKPVVMGPRPADHDATEKPSPDCAVWTMRAKRNRARARYEGAGTGSRIDTRR